MELLQIAPESTFSITLNQFAILLIFVISQTATIVGYFFYVMKKIKETSTELKAAKSESNNQYNYLEQAFLNRNKFCDMKYELTKERLDKNEIQNGKIYNDINLTLEKLNKTIQEFNNSMHQIKDELQSGIWQANNDISKHIEYHKGLEDKKK